MKKKLTLIMTVVYIFSCVIIPTSASTLDNAKREQQKIKDQIAQTKKEQEALANELKQNASDKENIESQVMQTQMNAKKKATEVSSIKTDIKLINQEIEALDKEYEYKLELFKTRMRVMYQNMNKSKLEIFIESKSLNEFFNRLKYISMVKENDEELINEMSVLKQNTEEKKQEKLKVLDEKKAQLKKLNAAVSDLNSSKAELENTIEAQEARNKYLEKSLDDFISQSEQLGKKIQALMDNTTKYAGGIMKWPTPGYTRISSPFGYRIHPVYKVKKMHHGIDIDAPGGATIVAANSGKVILAAWNGGYGNCVIIDHGDGIATLYGHQSKILVSVGDKLAKGDTVGKVGTTGVSTGDHLHFEVRVNGTAKDPMPYFTSK